MMSSLQHGVQTAEKRVVWSSLYLGTGSREAELVYCQLRTHTDWLQQGLGTYMSPLEVFAIRLKWNQVINVFQTQKNQWISDT